MPSRQVMEPHFIIGFSGEQTQQYYTNMFELIFKQNAFVKNTWFHDTNTLVVRFPHSRGGVNLDV